MNTKLRKTNFNNEESNPCLEESKLSRECLEGNGYLYNKCAIYFDNYNACKKFWGNIYSTRKRAGIKPNMPTKDERQKIMEQRQKRAVSGS